MNKRVFRGPQQLRSGDKVENPVLDFLGMELEELKESYARFCMCIRSEFLQAAGTLQGGLSIAFSDEAAAHAVMTTLSPGENVATIELKNNFLATASTGRLTAEATVYKRGRKIIIVDSVVRNEKGKDISRGSATMMVIGAMGNDH